MQIKQSLIATGFFSDTVPCHLASGLGAGFFAVCIGSPVDVVKSRMMGMHAIRLCGCNVVHLNMHSNMLYVCACMPAVHKACTRWAITESLSNDCPPVIQVNAHHGLSLPVCVASFQVGKEAMPLICNLWRRI